MERIKMSCVFGELRLQGQSTYLYTHTHSAHIPALRFNELKLVLVCPNTAVL